MPQSISLRSPSPITLQDRNCGSSTEVLDPQNQGTVSPHGSLSNVAGSLNGPQQMDAMHTSGGGGGNSMHFSASSFPLLMPSDASLKSYIQTTPTSMLQTTGETCVQFLE